MTDYNFRGISQTDRKPAIQGGVELQIYDNLFYLGVWGSNVDLATSRLPKSISQPVSGRNSAPSPSISV